MQLSLSLVGDSHSEVVEVAAQGDSAFTTPAPGAHVQFDTLLGADWNSRRVLLNMERAAYIDSACIGWLIASQKNFRANGGEMVLHSVQPAVRNVLELLKIGRVVPIAADAATGRTLLLGGRSVAHV